MNGCRACLKIIPNDTPIFYLNDIYMDPMNTSCDTISIKDKLTDCVPELLIETTINDLICKPCVTSLMAAYDFRQRCLKVEHKIHDYKRELSTTTEVDIGQIAMYYNNREESKILISAENEKTFLTPKIEPITYYNNIEPNNIKVEIPEQQDEPNFIKEFNKKNKLECNTCGHKSTTPYKLKCHVRIHNPIYSTECPKCDFLCKRDRDLRAHLRKRHKCSDIKESEEKKSKKERNKEKRQRIKESKQLIAKMAPILVITPK